MSNLVPFSNYVEVNPARYIPDGLNLTSKVSFVPMADTSESGHWFGNQVRRLNEVLSGFTNFKNNDVLVAKITPCFENGKGAFVADLENGVGFGSTEFHVLRAKQGTCARFIFHVTQWPQFRLSSERFMTGSAGQKRVQTLAFSQFEIADFGEDEQKNIATILDTLDTQIRQTEAIIAKLQQVKQGLLHDLLTRGIDENGQLRPPYEQAPELYKDSPLGWIPKEWEATELGNAISHIDAGRSPSCPDIPAPSGAWGVLKVSAVHPDGFKEQETKIVEQVVFHNPQIEVKDGDLLITRANTPELVGLPCLVSTERDRLMLSDKTLRLNFKEGQNKAFFFYVLTQSWVRSQIQVAATGTSMSMKNISQLSLKNLKVKQPPTTEQAKISQRVYEAGRQIREETLLLEKIKKQKAGLMDDLLTGRVRVTELIDQAQRAS
ncbi:restriction endonuclease subunit S [Vreelandella venusta]|uniref:restriction endonuclease subunit S n=1 Tax=Vreelandella venusta TaxID=44935 RepID=UPI003F67A520